MRASDTWGAMAGLPQLLELALGCGTISTPDPHTNNGNKYVDPRDFRTEMHAGRVAGVTISMLTDRQTDGRTGA